MLASLSDNDRRSFAWHNARNISLTTVSALPLSALPLSVLPTLSPLPSSPTCSLFPTFSFVASASRSLPTFSFEATICQQLLVSTSILLHPERKALSKYHCALPIATGPHLRAICLALTSARFLTLGGFANSSSKQQPLILFGFLPIAHIKRYKRFRT